MADPGETLRFSADLKDAAGVFVNAQTVVLTVTLPDGTTATPAVTNPPATTGKYFHDYTPPVTVLGRVVGSWVFTMAGGNVVSYVETFDVGSSLVTVDEARAHLRATVGVIDSAADLEQLQWLCFVATDAVERDLGRVLTRRTVTEVHSGGGNVLILRRTPVISVTSVTESGTALTVADYVLDVEAGILHRGTTTYAGRFTRGYGNVTVVYVAGYNNPPPVVRKVALNTIQGMWQSSQQASHRLLDESAETFGAAVTGGLNPLEMRAYDSLRAAGVA